MTFSVGVSGGTTVSSVGVGSTVDNLTIPRISHNTRINLTSMWVNLSTAGKVTITVPEGTPDGLYSGQFTLPYTALACVGENRCAQNDLWQSAASGGGTLTGEIRIRVVGGQPVDPDIHCQQLSASPLSINLILPSNSGHAAK